MKFQISGRPEQGHVKRVSFGGWESVRMEGDIPEVQCYFPYRVLVLSVSLSEEEIYGKRSGLDIKFLVFH